MSKCMNKKQFDKIVLKVQEHLEQTCCPDCALSILGAVAGSIIWNCADNNKGAEADAKEFCELLTFHIETLNQMNPDQEVTLQ